MLMICITLNMYKCKYESEYKCYLHKLIYHDIFMKKMFYFNFFPVIYITFGLLLFGYK